MNEYTLSLEDLTVGDYHLSDADVFALMSDTYSPQGDELVWGEELSLYEFKVYH